MNKLRRLKVYFLKGKGALALEECNKRCKTKGNPKLCHSLFERNTKVFELQLSSSVAQSVAFIGGQRLFIHFMQKVVW